MAGVGDAGGTGIGDEGDVAGGEGGEESVLAGAFVEGVVADEGSVNSEVGKEAAGVAGVLGGDEGDLAKGAEGAGGDVFEIADGGGDDVEGAHTFTARRFGEQMIERLYLWCTDSYR